MKTSKKEKKRLVLISSLIILLIFVLILSTYGDFKQILENKNTIILLEKEYSSLIHEEKSLNSDVTKLSDPEYVARYAKEKYMFSTDGEVIIRMED